MSSWSSTSAAHPKAELNLISPLTRLLVHQKLSPSFGLSATPTHPKYQSCLRSEIMLVSPLLAPQKAQIFTILNPQFLSCFSSALHTTDVSWYFLRSEWRWCLVSNHKKSWSSEERRLFLFFSFLGLLNFLLEATRKGLWHETQISHRFPMCVEHKILVHEKQAHVIKK
jgi:hypothetical protein